MKDRVGGVKLIDGRALTMSDVDKILHEMEREYKAQEEEEEAFSSTLLRRGTRVSREVHSRPSPQRTLSLSRSYLSTQEFKWD